MHVNSNPSMDQPRSSSILRLDRSSRSFGATSPTLANMQVGPSQPQSSASRQSVTFVVVECREEPRERSPMPAGIERADDTQRTSVAVTSDRAESSENSRGPGSVERSTAEGEADGNEDDYSASVYAIIQRRNSARRQSRRKRRSSSPFGVDVDSETRRRSSAHTMSSGDTIIPMEETGNQEQIFENLKLHKEVLSGVKQQPWPLWRKIKLVQQAKDYVRQHEGALQERLAQSRNTKDVIARVSLFMTKKWQYFRREFINLRMWLIPWEVRIMEIESHFGSAVASYFLFLRWLFWINFVIAITLTAFVAIPEVLTANVTLASGRKNMLEEERVKSKHLLTLWEFEGVLKYSPFFYGWYTNQDSHSTYRLPLAYFVTNLVVYTYSFVAILRKMAKNSRLSKLTEKEDEYVFSWKLFTGWDFMIGNPETAHNRTASIVLGFKEALLEEAEKQKDERNWRVITMRIFVNVAVLSLLALSAYAVVRVVKRSAKESESRNWWRQNEITIVMSLITYVFPILFEILGFLESYHPRKQLRMQLARIMVLNLLNLYSLIFALFNKINSMRHYLSDLTSVNTECRYKRIPCSGDLKRKQLITLASLSLGVINNVTHSHVKREIWKPTLPSVRQETPYLNPTLNSEIYEDDFNNTLDENYDEYSRVDGDNYYNETSDADDPTVAELYTTSYYEESKSTDRASDNMTNYNASSSTEANLFTDSTTVENSSGGSISYGSETVSVITEMGKTEESSMTTGIDDFTEEPTTATLISDSGESSTTNCDTSTVTEAAPTVATTTYVPDNSVSTSKSNQVIPFSTEVPKITEMCYEKTCATTPPQELIKSDLKTQKKLRQLCWETMFGQELAKLTVMDLVLTILATLSMDFFRAVFVRFMNRCWCWDLEKQFPQYGDFKIAENILHLVYNQGMVWMGMFFSPGLTVLNLLKLGILMYLRSWAVLTCNVPHEVVFRASRSNNFYFALLLTMLFLCVLPVGYAIVWVEPSWYCGPFSGYPKIYNLATKSLTDSLPKVIQRCLDYIASPGIIIPLIVLMTLIIYYMTSLAGSLREANNDLKVQLRHERTEERRKLFKIAEKRQNVADTPLSRWKEILPHARAEVSRNSEVIQRDDVQITIGNPIDISEREQLTTDAEQDSLRHDQMLPNCSNEKQNKKEDDLNDTNSNRKCDVSNYKPVNFVGCSWDSQSSEQTVIPEIQLNNEEKTVSDVQRSTETNEMLEVSDEEKTKCNE